MVSISNVGELERRLQEEGCNSDDYAIGAQSGKSEAYCLVEDSGTWRIRYSERGSSGKPLYETEDEAQACTHFFMLIMEQCRNHCIGFFRSQKSADELRQKLKDNKLESHQDRILFRGPDDYRYRVFVHGKAIFVAEQVLKNIPLED